MNRLDQDLRLELGAHEVFAASQAACLATTVQLVGSKVVDTMLYHVERNEHGDPATNDQGQLVQPAGEFAPTTLHSIRVAALMDMAVDDSCSPQALVERERLQIDGVLHDIIKLWNPKINGLVWSGRVLSDAELAFVRTHAPLGGVCIRAFAGPDMSKADRLLLEAVADDVALHHGGDRMTETATLLTVADNIDAMLLDWIRTYKFKRFLRDRLLDAAGRPNVKAIKAKILQGKPETALGVSLKRMVEIGCILMPRHMAAAGIETGEDAA